MTTNMLVTCEHFQNFTFIKNPSKRQQISYSDRLVYPLLIEYLLINTKIQNKFFNSLLILSYILVVNSRCTGKRKNLNANKCMQHYCYCNIVAEGRTKC